jgi:hypothetical protein
MWIKESICDGKGPNAPFIHPKRLLFGEVIEHHRQKTERGGPRFAIFDASEQNARKCTEG